MASAYDYEAIVKGFFKKDVISEELEAKKDTLDSEHWTALNDYWETEAKYKCAETSNIDTTNLCFGKIKIRNDIDQQQIIFQEKLKNLQILKAELEPKRKIQMESYFKQAEELCKKFLELPNEFNIENINNQISSLAESVNFLNQGVINAKLERDSLKNIMENSEPQTSNIKAINKMIEKEKVTNYEDSKKTEARLRDLSGDIRFLSNKIQDITIKNSI